MRNIKRVSKFMRYVFTAIFIAYPLSLIVFWIIAPQSIAIGNMQNGIHLSYIPANIPILIPLSYKTKILGFIISLIPATVYMFLLYFLIHLFSLYEKAKIFAAASASCIRKIGYMLLLGQILHPIYQVLMSVAMTYNNPPNYRFLNFNFSETNIGVILIGIIIILVSWVMSEGCRLQQEQDYTI